MPRACASAALRSDDGLPVDEHFALVRCVHTGHDLDEGRLAGAVLSDQRVHFARAQFQRDVVERTGRPEALRDRRASRARARRRSPDGPPRPPWRHPGTPVPTPKPTFFRIRSHTIAHDRTSRGQRRQTAPTTRPRCRHGAAQAALRRDTAVRVRFPLRRRARRARCRRGGRTSSPRRVASPANAPRSDRRCADASSALRRSTNNADPLTSRIDALVFSDDVSVDIANEAESPRYIAPCTMAERCAMTR